MEVPSCDLLVVVTSGFLPHLCLFKSFGVTIDASLIYVSASPINFISHSFAISMAFPTMLFSKLFKAVINPILFPESGGTDFFDNLLVSA